MDERLHALRAVMHERDLEALLVTTPANRRYLSGFTGSAGALLVTSDKALVFTDFRYRDQVGREAPGFELRQISAEEPLSKRFAEVVRELRLHCIAFEGDHVSVAQHAGLIAALSDVSAALISRTGLIEDLRAVKNADELAILRRAIAITDEGFNAWLPLLRPDVSERQAAWLLEMALREHGADGLSFETIVAAGPNGANPHARTSNELLGTGRPIVVDFGALLDGYHADLTRTIVLGEPDTRFMNIYETVHTAQQRAIRGIKAGISGRDADALARNYLAEAGYGEQFGHSLGHGVGLDIHEGPSLRSVNEQPLPVGCVVSVEPGVYISDWGGIRIEDLVLVQPDGCEVLSHAPYEPVVS